MLAENHNINLIRLNQEDILNDQTNWDSIITQFITRIYKNDNSIEIYDAADGGRYKRVRKQKTDAIIKP